MAFLGGKNASRSKFVNFCKFDQVYKFYEVTSLEGSFSATVFAAYRLDSHAVQSADIRHTD